MPALVAPVTLALVAVAASLLLPPRALAAAFDPWDDTVRYEVVWDVVDEVTKETFEPLPLRIGDYECFLPRESSVSS